MIKKLFRVFSILVIAMFFIILLYPNRDTISTKIDATKEDLIKDIKISGKETLIIYIKKSELENDKSEDVKIMTLKEAEEVKKKLLSIEENYYGIKKIQEQIKLLKEAELLSNEINLDKIIKCLEKINARSQIFVGNNVIFGKFMLISHFIPGGYIHGIAPLGKWYYNTSSKNINWLFKGTKVSKTTAALPLFLGVSFAATYVTVIDSELNSCTKIFSPFIEILTPVAGISIRVIIWENTDYPAILFEYNLDICLIGFLAGFSIF